MKRYIRSSNVTCSTEGSSLYLVTVGDLEEYEVEAQSESDAIQFVVDNYLTPEDIEEYEDDPSYIWARRADEEDDGYGI